MKANQDVKRQPDYKLAALCRENEHKGNIGAAWRNEDGSISIVLEPFVVLDASRKLLLTLFPRGRSPSLGEGAS